MNILVVAATGQEISPFLQKHPQVDHLITGVGTTCTTYHLTRRLRQMDYDLVIQAGVAGVFGDAFQLGEVVCIQRDGFAGSGVLENGNQFSLFEKSLWTDEHPFTHGWLMNNMEGLDQFGFPLADAITVDMVTNDPLINNRIFEKYHPAAVESMEGAAFHYVCLMEEISFLQLRAISNKVGEREKTLWRMDEAISNLNAALEKMVTKFVAV